MKQNYNLTTKEGTADAIKEMGGLLVLSILLFILLKALFRNEAALNSQKKVAEELIRHGKDSGLAEMDITMDNFTGINLDVPIDECNISTKLGADDKMHIHVTYK